MTMTKIGMLTNERNLIIKRENDWTKRYAKPLNETVKTQIDVTNLVLNYQAVLNVVICLFGFMTTTKTFVNENFCVFVNVTKSLTKWDTFR